jgi:hypothetical protein
MTLNDLWERVTVAELQLWSAFYTMEHEDREKERNK